MQKVNKELMEHVYRRMFNDFDSPFYVKIVSLSDEPQSLFIQSRGKKKSREKKTRNRKK